MEVVQLRQVHRPISQQVIALETEWPNLDRIAGNEIAVIGVAEAVAQTDLFIDCFKLRFFSSHDINTYDTFSKKMI